MRPKIKQTDLEKWADYLLNHSLGGIQKDDIVMIKGENITWPLMSVLQDKIFAAGAQADINMVAPDNNRGQVWGASIAKHGTLAQIQKVPAWQTKRYEAMTKYIEILGAESPDLFANLPEKLNSAITKADMPFKKLRLSKPWVLTLYPTEAFANMEDMTLEEYTDVVVSTSLTDPKLLEEVEEPIYQLMNESDQIRIETQNPETGKLLEMTMDIAKRNNIKCTGHSNFPDGEVFTSPNANSVNGEICV